VTALSATGTAVDELAGRVDQLQAAAPGVLIIRLLVDEQAITAAHGHGLVGDVLAAVDDRIHLHAEPLGGDAVPLGPVLGDTEFAIVLPLPDGATGYAIAWARHQIAIARTRVTVPAHRLGEHLVPVTAVLGAVLATPAGSARRWPLLTDLLRLADDAARSDRAGGDPLALCLGDLLPHQGVARLAALSPAPTCQEILMTTIPVSRDLLKSLVVDDDCWLDHHGGCQSHGYLSLQPGEKCPQQELKDLLANGAEVER
jgi:GGDEF domain-containing protein